MKPEDQIKALAELDNYSDFKIIGDKLCGKHPSCLNDSVVKAVGLKAFLEVPNYLNSYDAIIVLIQKQCLGSERTEAEFVFQLGKAVMSSYSQIQLVGFTALGAKPAQLSEALLKATGKWVE